MTDPSLTPAFFVCHLEWPSDWRDLKDFSHSFEVSEYPKGHKHPKGINKLRETPNDIYHSVLSTQPRFFLLTPYSSLFPQAPVLNHLYVINDTVG